MKILSGHHFGERYRVVLTPGSTISRFYDWYTRKYKVRLRDVVPLTDSEKHLLAAYRAGFRAGLRTSTKATDSGKADK